MGSIRLDSIVVDLISFLISLTMQMTLQSLQTYKTCKFEVTEVVAARNLVAHQEPITWSKHLPCTFVMIMACSSTSLLLEWFGLELSLDLLQVMTLYLLVVLHDIWVSAIITLSKRFAVNLKKSYHQDEGLSTVVLIVGVASDMVLHSLPGKKNINM